MLIDTHCHLSDPAFDPDREEVVARMRAAGVGRALVIESRPDAVSTTRSWLAQHPCLGLATGCHPHDASRWDDLRDQMGQWWAGAGVLAAGEIGLDYHYDHAPRSVQIAVFEEQLAMAVQANLPVIIHAREADADVAAVLSTQPAATVILHSFSSGPELRDAALDRGWYLSFSGMVTFRSWNQADTVASVPLDRLMIETDSPYLAPVPYRGKRNEPSFVVQVAAEVARVRQVSVPEIAAATTANANRVFWRE